MRLCGCTKQPNRDNPVELILAELKLSRYIGKLSCSLDELYCMNEHELDSALEQAGMKLAHQDKVKVRLLKEMKEAGKSNS